MNEKKIEQLLDSFYKGCSTDEEEQLLITYFTTSEVIPAKWQSDRKLFLSLAEHAKASEGLEDRLESFIDQLEKQENKKSAAPIGRSFLYWIGGVAAAIFLCLMLIPTISNQHGEEYVADSFTDPVEAALVAQEALLLLSENLNKGMDQMNEAGKEIKNANQIINKYLKD